MSERRFRLAAALCAALVGGCATGGVHPPASPAVSPAAPPAAQTAAAPPGLPEHGGALAPTAPPAPAARVTARFTIGAVGDVLMHDAVKQSAAAHGGGASAPDAGFGWLFAPIADLLSEPDVMFANLETPIAPKASRGSRAFVFNAPAAVVTALQHAGVDLVSVANNHAFDQGRAGFEETLRTLDAAGMAYVGGGPAAHPAGPVVVERHGLRVGFLGYTYGLNQPGNVCPPEKTPAPAPARECVLAAEIDRDHITADVERLAATVEAVVVSLHWGVEYEQQPRAADVELAHRLADAGALVVLGHHPHVLQPIELYRRADGRVAVIAYSLGNFVSNQSRNYVSGVSADPVAATRDGVLLRVAIARRDYGRGVTRVEVDGADFLPLWTENDTMEIDRRRDPTRRPAIRVVANDRALAEVRAALSALPDPLPPGEEERYVALKQREALLAGRRAAVASLLGDDLLRVLKPAELPTPGAAAAPPATAAAPAEP
jgi:poly-gamma-glutamate synthesis protein (capsule biosynthesis protein)